MSQRNRDTDVPTLPRQERRAHAHSERHRIHVELQNVAQTVSAGIEPEDVHEPGSAWKPMHRHDAEVAKSKLAKRGRVKRHWKTKMWKRRTQMRQEKIDAWKMARENPTLAG
ncbi:hypothetical protein [Ilumatobacter coccineus]|jgi:hypothetical protein|uniref:Uncharacterized protein n=1 Tax=Ilumatobacter coccineus (strain NBRC 103263 / KCTC 29153 / YM16-304) TaxID=1313172 RepID=A0A6C7ECD0_ILUCY|nr:hypothetical protein [Ilumatobacter coccineus]BAN03662.1 hypothetical protein YM304_33480 [Ilumatobacter coccineus YM16-304]